MAASSPAHSAAQPIDLEPDSDVPASTGACGPASSPAIESSSSSFSFNPDAPTAFGDTAPAGSSSSSDDLFAEQLLPVTSTSDNETTPRATDANEDLDAPHMTALLLLENWRQGQAAATGGVMSDEQTPLSSTQADALSTPNFGPQDPLLMTSQSL